MRRQKGPAGHSGRRVLLAVCLALLTLAGPWTSSAPAQVGLPSRLSDPDFWQLITDMSEPDGFFRSDNLVSNEDTFQRLIPDLKRTVRPGGVYVGVGPDQNFTYIANLRPAVVFIPDVRRGNLHMHLMYKALMELSADRAEFLSRLFSRPRPDGLTSASTAEQLFNAYARVVPTRAAFTAGIAEVLGTLKQRHGFTLSEMDTAGIEYILANFYEAGPFLTYSSTPFGRGARYPSFAELQMQTDAEGIGRAYLATEENYQAVRSLQRNNLIVPLVGNFGGPKTLRAVGTWVARRGGRITTFYTSNVEQYLFQDRVWHAFAGNMAAFPVDETSTLIRSCFNDCISPVPGSRVTMLLDSIPALVRDYQAGLIGSYYDVLSRRR